MMRLTLPAIVFAKELAPMEGLEPTTFRLKSAALTTELHRNWRARQDSNLCPLHLTPTERVKNRVNWSALPTELLARNGGQESNLWHTDLQTAALPLSYLRMLKDSIVWTFNTKYLIRYFVFVKIIFYVFMNLYKNNLLYDHRLLQRPGGRHTLWLYPQSSYLFVLSLLKLGLRVRLKLKLVKKFLDD